MPADKKSVEEHKQQKERKRDPKDCIFCSNKGKTKFTFNGIELLACEKHEKMIMGAASEDSKITLVWQYQLVFIDIGSAVHDTYMKRLERISHECKTG